MPTIDAAGMVADAEFVPSPNCDERPAREPISLVVVHAISLPPGEFGGDGILRLFTNCLDPAAHPYYAEIHALRVSAHLLIRRDGSMVQFVPFGRRAWHAGVSSWRGRERCNDFSVGIELEGCDEVPFEPQQYRRLAAVIVALRQRHPSLEVAGHADIAPGRKTDPGACFDWPLLHSLLDENHDDAW